MRLELSNGVTFGGYLSKFLVERTLSKLDLLEFYTGAEVKQKYALLAAEIADLTQM